VGREIARDQVAVRFAEGQDVAQQTAARIVGRGLGSQRLGRHLAQLGHATGG
jgi:hypothetical protein